eukprot:6973630-Prymnesium_polylepis.1
MGFAGSCPAGRLARAAPRGGQAGGTRRVMIRLPRLTQHAGVLGSIPEAHQKDFLTLVRGMFSACPDGDSSHSPVGTFR